jgi:hypothetical protein
MGIKAYTTDQKNTSFDPIEEELQSLFKKYIHEELEKDIKKFNSVKLNYNEIENIKSEFKTFTIPFFVVENINYTFSHTFANYLDLFINQNLKDRKGVKKLLLKFFLNREQLSRECKELGVSIDSKINMYWKLNWIDENANDPELQ